MSLREQYESQGFLSPVDILDADEVAEHRSRLETAEAQIGGLHYLSKVHTVLTSPAELAVHPKILDVVEQLLGPDILLYNVTYIIKEAASPSHVTWHQDLTYWGLDSDDQVSLWLALSETSVESGCMRMIPGSHRQGRIEHINTEPDETNVLFQSQRVAAEIDEAAAVHCELKPGQGSFHHGWTLHASTPNRGNDRRIGLNIQYVAPHVRQTKLPGYTAKLVRGEDSYGYYGVDQLATADLETSSLARREQLEKIHRDITANA